MLAIGDLAGLSVATKVDEVDVAKLRQGQKAHVTGDAFPGITLVGMSANLEILTYEKPDALMVPVSTVSVDATGKHSARRKKANGVVEEVPVQTGYTTLDAVEITLGLKAGDVVDLLPVALSAPPGITALPK